MFEHQGNQDLNPAAANKGKGCGTGWMAPGGKPIVNTGVCACGNPMQHWLTSKNNSYKGLRIINSTSNLKLVHYDDDVGFYELFDLNADPYELHNVAGTPGMQRSFDEMSARLLSLRGCGAGTNATVRCP